MAIPRSAFLTGAGWSGGSLASGYPTFNTMPQSFLQQQSGKVMPGVNIKPRPATGSTVGAPSLSRARTGIDRWRNRAISGGPTPVPGLKNVNISPSAHVFQAPNHGWISDQPVGGVSTQTIIDKTGKPWYYWQSWNPPGTTLQSWEHIGVF